MEKDLAEGEDQIQAAENPHRPEHYKTVDAAEEYNGMLLQTDSELEFYKKHTAEWEARVNRAAAQVEKQMDEQEDIMEARENPSRPEHYANQNSKSEMYDGMLL